MLKSRLIVSLEIAIMAALAVVLSYIKFGAIWVMGGSISLMMVPIFIMVFRRGWVVGTVTGLLVGVLNLITGGYVVHPVQLVLDYPLAYTVLGLGGVLLLAHRRVNQQLSKTTIISVIAIGASLRFVSHFASGVIWFGIYAPEGMPVALYSFLYNISYLLPEAILTALVIILIQRYRADFFGPIINK